MRTHNVKRVQELPVFPRLCGVVVSLLAIGVLGYLWVVLQCQVLGRELKRLEADRERLQRRYWNEEYAWSQMKAPASLKEALARNGVAMNWPQSHQLVPVAGGLVAAAAAEVAPVPVVTRPVYARVRRARGHD